MAVICGSHLKPWVHFTASLGRWVLRKTKNNLLFANMKRSSSHPGVVSGFMGWLGCASGARPWFSAPESAGRHISSAGPGANVIAVPDCVSGGCVLTHWIRVPKYEDFHLSAICPGLLLGVYRTLALSRRAVVAFAAITGTTMLAGCGVSSTDLQVQGVLPGLQVTNTVTFAAQTLAVPVSQSISITNTGSVPLLITAISLSGANAAVFSETNHCVNVQVAASASCTVTLTFVPAAVGTATATLSITSNAVYGTVSVALTGTGVAPTGGLIINSAPFLIASFSAADIVTALNTSPVAAQLANAGVVPQCGVDIYSMSYWTVGGAAESTTATGAIMVPTGSGTCSGARPIVLYAHGTSTSQNYNLANIVDSNNPAYGESAALVAIYASQGFIVVAPNYAGYDASTLSYHPYLNATQQSQDMLDALTAARSALPLALTPSTTANTQLLVTGYSEGGYVAMATMRALQAAKQPITAVAAGSGPYALEFAGDTLFKGQVNNSATINLPLLTASYQRAYGLQVASSDIYSATYASGIDSLLPGTLSHSALISQGLLPDTAVFNSVAPNDADLAAAIALVPSAQLATANATGAQALLVSSVTTGFGFGSPALVNNSYRLNYLLDALSNPDPVLVPSGYSAAATAPAINGLRAALWQNDLRNGDWTPSAPLLMCGGGNDPTVLFQNTTIMQGLWTGHANVTLLNVDPAASPTSLVNNAPTNLQLVFVAAANAVASSAGGGAAGVAAVTEAYHAALVGPLCALAALDFFKTALSAP